MTEHRLEVADVVREHQEEFLAQWGHTVSPQQHKALRDIGACRTPALGGHLEQCDRCGHSVIAYDSCRNRHCPKCQFSAREKWLNERAKELLPAPYFHLVLRCPRNWHRRRRIKKSFITCCSVRLPKLYWRWPP